MALLRPFFTFFGGKFRAAPRYPTPACGAIVEPFAGSAGYALRHWRLNVTLVERDPKIAATWRYLLNVDAADVRALPLFDGTWASVDDLDICEPAKYLVGFWLNKGNRQPCKRPSAWMRSGIRPNSQWGEVVRERIASQLESVRHWRVIEADYRAAPDVEATWFIDPPYIAAGRHYRFGRDDVDYRALSEWCARRRGQVIVCENVGADWLPFRPFAVSKATHGRVRSGVSHEAVWTNQSGAV